MHYRLRNDLKIGNDSDSINSVFVEIDKSTADTKHNIIVGCVYRPPWVDLSYFNELINNVLDLLHSNHYVFLLGDFNVDLSHDVGTNLPIEEFKNIFLTHHLYPLINKPTREIKSSNTIIDNIFCNVPHALETCSVGIIRTYISDHHAVFCILDNAVPQNNKENTIIKRNFCDKNITKFSKYLMNETWDIVYTEGTQKAFTWFQGVMDLFFDNCFQKRILTMTYRNRYNWMTKKMRTQITEKNLLGHKTFRNPENLEMKNEYKAKRNRLISDLRNAEITYYNNELDIHKNDIKRKWKLLKTIIGKNTTNTKNKINFSINNTVITDSQLIADEFNNFFVSIGPQLANKISNTVSPLSYVHSVVNSIVISIITALEVRNIILSTKNSSPGWDDIPACVAKKCIDHYIDPLTHIINNSIQEGVFPSELKLARVVPLFKSGDSNQITKFRPISVLTFFSKIFERVMYNHLVHFLDSNGRLYQYQFGFRHGHSTQQAIITVVEKITSSLDNGDLVIGVFLDLKKAFNTVDHQILLRKLYLYGIRGNILKWFESYLSDRSQYVTYDGMQ